MFKLGTFYEFDAEDLDSGMIKVNIHVEFYQQFDVYIDEMTAALIDDVDDEFKEYFETFMKTQALGMLIENIYSLPENSRKIDIEVFAKRCHRNFGDGSITMRIRSDEVAEEIAKVLKKRGIIKLKGNRDTLRRAR